MYLARILFILFCLYFPLSMQADMCKLDNATMPSGVLMPMNGIIGQQFIACETGTIHAITVNTSGGNIDLYLTAGNGSTLVGGTIFESFPAQPAGTITLKLSRPFYVQAKMPYAFGISGPTSVRLDNSPTGPPANATDPDGLFLFGIDTGTFAEVQASDLFFAVDIEFTVIPTMSEWGLVIFGMFILNIATFLIRRQELLSL